MTDPRRGVRKYRQPKKTKRKPNRKRTCQGKRRFRDREEAVAAIRTLRTKSDRGKHPHRAYECPTCHGWHLTSQDPR